MSSAAGNLRNVLQVSLGLSAVVELLQGSASKVAELEAWMQLLGFDTQLKILVKPVFA